MAERETDTGAGGIPAGAVCPGCGEEILVGQSVVRLTAGLLKPGARLDELPMRPDVYLHAGAGYDPSYDVHDRWCLTKEGVEAAARLLIVSDSTSASGH
ncbi:MAG TPA: hypothetical protein VHR55_00295 [Candidatus Limnocylindria bacterium]|nr:hypothetical protein [Candidatus Limnocylindria bacterium]